MVSPLNSFFASHYLLLLISKHLQVSKTGYVMEHIEPRYGVLTPASLMSLSQLMVIMKIGIVFEKPAPLNTTIFVVITLPPTEEGDGGKLSNRNGANFWITCRL